MNIDAQLDVTLNMTSENNLILSPNQEGETIEQTIFSDLLLDELLSKNLLPEDPSTIKGLPEDLPSSSIELSPIATIDENKDGDNEEKAVDLATNNDQNNEDLRIVSLLISPISSPTNSTEEYQSIPSDIADPQSSQLLMKNDSRVDSKSQPNSADKNNENAHWEMNLPMNDSSMDNSYPNGEEEIIQSTPESHEGVGVFKEQAINAHNLNESNLNEINHFFPEIERKTTISSTSSPVFSSPYQSGIDHELTSESWEPAFHQQIIWLGKQAIEEAQIQLNPPELGPVSVKIHLVNDITQIHFNTNHAEVSQIITDSLPRLREMMSDNGINLGHVDVNTQQGQHSSPKEQQELADNPAALEDQQEKLSKKYFIRKAGMIDYFA